MSLASCLKNEKRSTAFFAISTLMSTVPGKSAFGEGVLFTLKTRLWAGLN